MICVPAVKVLRRLSDVDLAAVERFVVGRPDTGEIQFLQVTHILLYHILLYDVLLWIRDKLISL